MKQIKDVLGTSILQAAGASVVVWLWSQVMIYGNQFGTNTPNTMALVAIPLIFMVTAVLAGGAVLGYPLYLVLHEKNWVKAITLVLITLVWLAIIATLLVLNLTR
ncbi:MAG: hypothetical protein V1807_00740 [Patescibacteria group bacterium]